MDDWHYPALLAGKTDGELFYIITKGKGKMMGEGDRAPETMRWNLVNLVRSISKKEAGKEARLLNAQNPLTTTCSSQNEVPRIVIDSGCSPSAASIVLGCFRLNGLRRIVWFTRHNF